MYLCFISWISCLKLGGKLGRELGRRSGNLAEDQAGKQAEGQVDNQAGNPAEDWDDANICILSQTHPHTSTSPLHQIPPRTSIHLVR